MIADPTISTSRFLAAAFLAAGIALGLTVSAAPAAAQETPWYMPQPWVYPQSTAPTGFRRPGSYGHSNRYYRAYGSFSNYCYGDCGYRRGTIATSGGVILYRPVVVLLDPRDFEVVPRGYYGAQQPVSQYASAPPQPSRYTAPRPSLVRIAPEGPALPTPNFTEQNGVRIITPRPLN